MLNYFCNFKKFFCYKKSKEESLNIISSDCSIYLYKKLRPYENNFKKFILKFFENSENKEIEYLLCIENLIKNNIFLKVLKKIDRNFLIKIMNEKIIDKELYNSILNYFQYLSLKSKIFLYKKKWNIFKIKKELIKKENSENLIKVLHKKINLLDELNIFLNNDIINSEILETISKSKRKKLFQEFSFEIFKQIILYTIKIKIFESDQIQILNELIITLNNVIENFTNEKKKSYEKKTKKKLKPEKIEKINKYYIINIIQNIRYYILDNNIEEFNLSLSAILKSLLKEFPEETELILFEITKLVYKKQKKNDLSTIYEESHLSIFEESEDKSFFKDIVNKNDSVSSIGRGLYNVESRESNELKIRRTSDDKNIRKLSYDKKIKRSSFDAKVGSVNRFKE